MSVWIICDADPDCDQHIELDVDAFTDLVEDAMALTSNGLPDEWAGWPLDARCPDHAPLHVPF